MNSPSLHRGILPARALLLLALALFLSSGFHTLTAQTLLIRADRVMTSAPEGMVGARFILLEGGRIVSVTENRPSGLPGNAEVLDAAYLTPGFIDARTTLGLTALHPSDDDRDETSDPNQAHLRAIDAFDLNDALVQHALRSGVTTVQTGPGDANSIGGQAGIFKLTASTVAEATLRSPSALVISLAETAKLTYGSANRFPSTRMANVGLIRQALLDAQRYGTQAEGENPPTRDLKKEMISQVLDGDIPALVSANRVDEIDTALRLAEEFGFEMAIAGATSAQVMLDRLEMDDVPLLLGPPGDAALESADGEGILSTAAAMERRGIPFALISGDDEDAPRGRLLDRAVQAVGGGLSEEEAIRAITINPARILGLAGTLGSVEVGKVGDLVLFDGPPLAPGSHILAVVVAGGIVYQRGG